MTLNAKAVRQHDQLRPGGRSESWGASGTALSESRAWVCEPGEMRGASECCLDADARAGCGRACEVGHGRVIKIRPRAKSLKPLVLSSDLPAYSPAVTPVGAVTEGAHRDGVVTGMAVTDSAVTDSAVTGWDVAVTYGTVTHAREVVTSLAVTD